MAASQAMRRLLRVLEIEEEQSRAALDAAIGELRKLEGALRTTREQDRRGRQLVVLSAANGELADRLAGLEESRLACLRVPILKSRIAQSEANVSERRQEFLLRRLDRRKTETMLRQTEAKAATMERRRGQRGLDDLFLTRMRRNRNA